MDHGIRGRPSRTVIRNSPIALDYFDRAQRQGTLRLQLFDLSPQPLILLLEPLPLDDLLSPLSHEKDRANCKNG